MNKEVKGVYNSKIVIGNLVTYNDSLWVIEPATELSNGPVLTPVKVDDSRVSIALKDIK
jgi:hypothetical protein